MQVKFTIDYDLIELHILNDNELCDYLLNPTLCEGLIYTQRIYD